MKLPLFLTGWQRLAGFRVAIENRFSVGFNLCNLGTAQRFATTKPVQQVKNRYPSPSHRSGQYFLTGPLFFLGIRQFNAGNTRKSRDVIEYHSQNALLDRRGEQHPRSYRGRTLCKPNYQSLPSWPFSHFPPVVAEVLAAGAQTLSALQSAALPAVLPGILSTKANALRAPFWAQVQAHWSTIWATKPNTDTSKQGLPGNRFGGLFYAPWGAQHV